MSEEALNKHKLVVREFDVPGTERLERVYICVRCGRRRDAPYDFTDVDCLAVEPNWEFVSENSYGG